MFSLRYYQEDAVSAFKNYTSEHWGKCPLIVIPTGGGKSLIIAYIIRWMLEFRDTRILLLTHEQHLIMQNFNELMENFDNEIFLYHVYKNTMISELSSIQNNESYCFSNAEFIEDYIVLSVNFEKFTELFLSKNILTTELLEILLNKTHQLQGIVNRELVFDATAKVAFMLNQDLEMFNKLKRQ